MENIFLLPSTNPSRLHFDGKELFTTINLQLGKTINSIVESRNIYITNSEEINKDTKPCWCINTIKNTWNDDLIYYQGAMPQYHYIGFKKIILTTNPELIKNGVQSLDDNFLNWFVKNPSCEFVEVKREECQMWSLIGCDKNDAGCCKKPIKGYTPIIPTQEQKQDLYFAFDVPKQETIDEVAHKYAREQPINKTSHMMGFIAGAKHQSEKMISDLKKFAEWLQDLRTEKDELYLDNTIQSLLEIYNQKH